MVRRIKSSSRVSKKRPKSRARVDKPAATRRDPVKRPPDPRMEGDWDNFEGELGRVLLKCRYSEVKLVPYDQPEATLKRHVYKFAREQLASGNDKKLAYLLWYKRAGEQRAHRISFQENPFHWVLSAIHPQISELDRPSLSKIGRQLLYAHRHDIDPDLLVGFLYQSGSPDVISKKAKALNKREQWYLDRQKNPS